MHGCREQLYDSVYMSLTALQWSPSLIKTQFDLDKTRKQLVDRLRIDMIRSTRFTHSFVCPSARFQRRSLGVVAVPDNNDNNAMHLVVG
jgi:hypothetical protein